MNKFDQSKLQLSQDINKVIIAIDDEVDTFVVSRMHTNPKIRKLANEAYERKRENRVRTAKIMIRKYGRHN